MQAPLAIAVGAAVGNAFELETSDGSMASAIGWQTYGKEGRIFSNELAAPSQQEMQRVVGAPDLGRWSVAY